MIEIRHLSYAIRGNRILKDISLTFPRGKITGIIGPNGCGKSTLLAHVARLRPSRETIFIDGTPVETIPAADYARKLAVLAQRHLQMAAELSVRDVVLMGRYPYKERFQSYSPHDIEVAETVMQQFRILSMAEKKIGRLSGGELQRVFVAKALAQDPEVLLLDEPTNHLDMESKEILERAIRAFPGTVLYVSHDRYFINRTATRILNLTSRCLVNYIGNYDYYLEKKADAERAALPVSSPVAKGEENESPSPSAEDYKTQKAQKAAEKKRRAELEALEQRIAELEETLRGIEEEFLLPENQRDAAALLAIQKRKDSAEEELADCYERWETLAD